MPKKRVHTKRCAASKGPWKKCRCICGGRDHGSDHKEPGLLRFVPGAQEARAPQPPKRKRKNDEQ